MPSHVRTSFPFPMTAAYAMVLFVALVAIMRALLSALGIAPPDRPDGPSLVNLYAFLVPSFALLACGLALLARGMSGGFKSRWLTLSAFSWVTSSWSSALGMTALATSGAVRPIELTLYLFALMLVPSFAAGAVCALAFVPVDARPAFKTRLNVFRTHQPPWQWAWRVPLGIALSAAMLALATFALGPLVGGDVPHGIALQIGRGLLLSAVALAVVVLWERSGLQLFASLAFAMAAPAAVAAWVYGYFIPHADRAIGVVEVVASSVILSGVMVALWLGRHADDHIDEVNAAETAAPLPAF